VGYGLEGVIPDAIASRIIEEFVLPEFRAGRYGEGVLAGVNQILVAARGEELQVPRSVRGDRAPGRRSKPSLLVWLLVLMIFGWRGFFFLPFLGGPRGYRGGFGGGFGGGGGGFGGGGASGGW
jgi:uncharacterized protein